MLLSIGPRVTSSNFSQSLDHRILLRKVRAHGRNIVSAHRAPERGGFFEFFRCLQSPGSQHSLNSQWRHSRVLHNILYPQGCITGYACDGDETSDLRQTCSDRSYFAQEGNDHEDE
jgi:hypothetical protein